MHRWAVHVQVKQLKLHFESLHHLQVAVTLMGGTFKGVRENNKINIF